MATKAPAKAATPVATGSGEVAPYQGGATRAQRIQTESQAVAAEAASSNTPAPAATPTPAATDPNAAADAANLQSASSTLTSFLQSIPGLSTLDPTGALASWINSTSSTLAGQGLASSDIVSQITSTINNPGASGDTAAQGVFDALFPGYNQKIANGTTNSDGSYTGIAGYIAYSAQLQQYATTAGLTTGTITPALIGNLWANNVSADEVNTRINTEYANAQAAPQAVKDHLASYYGVTTGDIASYYLNPTNTVAKLQQQFNTASVGGAATTTGFGEISAAQASTLAAFLAPTSTTNVSEGQAANALTSQLGNGVQGSAAQLAAGGFESTPPGQSSATSVTADTLLAGVEGNAPALQQVEHAQETRTAGSKGGGGATTTANGAVGLGFAGS